MEKTEPLARFPEVRSGALYEGLEPPQRWAGERERHPSGPGWKHREVAADLRHTAPGPVPRQHGTTLHGPEVPTHGGFCRKRQ